MATLEDHKIQHRHRPEERWCNPLIVAVCNGNNAEAFKLLAEKKYSVNSRTERKETPLHFAMCYSRTQLIERLIETGAKVNKRNLQGRTPLIMGVISAELSVLKMFVKACASAKAGLDLNKPNYFGETPLHHAVCHDRPEVVEYLIRLGVNLDLKTIGGKNAVFMAQEEDQRRHMLYMLVRSGAKTEKCVLKGMPNTELPSMIKEGFLDDPTMMMHDRDFNGALFQDHLPVFHFGIQPKEGLCVEIRLTFFVLYHCLQFSTMRGMIYRVESPNKIRAIVKLNCDHENLLKALQGEWDATLEIVANLQFPWKLISLTKFNADSKIKYASVVARAHELDASRGRKYVLGNGKQRAANKPHQCKVLKGMEGDCKDALIVTALHLNGPADMTLKFENGPDERLTGEKAQMLLQRTVEAKLDPKGKIETEIFVNGCKLSSEDYGALKATVHPNMVGTNSAACYSCSYCHQLSKIKLRKCGRCGGVTYCNEECRNKHWSEHKKVCKKP